VIEIPKVDDVSPSDRTGGKSRHHALCVGETGQGKKKNNNNKNNNEGRVKARKVLALGTIHSRA
jgi:hypothetical protein